VHIGGYPRVRADQAQLLGVIRFQVGLLRYRRLCLCQQPCRWTMRRMQNVRFCRMLSASAI
jgi:hypothetical protein